MDHGIYISHLRLLHRIHSQNVRVYCKTDLQVQFYRGIRRQPHKKRDMFVDAWNSHAMLLGIEALALQNRDACRCERRDSRF
jgi:hypothetical protein